MYTIAKYLRISAEDIDIDGFDKYESNSISNQRGFLDEFVLKMPDFIDCNVIEVIDDGYTGTNFSRPGVQRLIKMVQRGEVQCIVVKDLSRWGRNYIEVGDFLEQKFPEWGIRFISLTDCFDTANIVDGNDSINIAFRNLVHEMYSRDLSEKVRSAKKAVAQSGKSPGGMAFYGYIYDPADHRKFILDEETTPVIKRIFELAISGSKLTQISRILNDEEIPTPMERKRQIGYHRHRWAERNKLIWRDCMISKIIHDERYTGKMICGKRKVADVGSAQVRVVPQEDWIIVPGALPAIITEEQFTAANIPRRASLSKKKAESKLILSRKLKCAHCDTAMKAMHRKYEVVYNCDSSRFKDGFSCTPNEKLREKEVVAAVFDALKQQISLAEKAREILNDHTGQLTPQINAIQREIENLERLAEKTKTAKLSLWEKFQLGEITGAAFQNENEKLDTQIQRHNKKIPALQEKLRTIEMETGQENVFVERFCKQAGAQELTRKMVEEFIHEVKVYSATHIEVIFNFADEYAKIAPFLANTKSKHTQ